MNALICGGGIAGLALAQRLTSHGWNVTIVERAPGPRESGYMIDFFGLGYDAAEAMGVLPRLLELGYAVGEWSYVDERGRERAGMSFKGFAQVMGGRLVTIMRPSLELALREQLQDSVDLRYSCSVSDVDDLSDGVRVQLTDGTSHDVDLLVGADGIHSTVRRLVFGPEEEFFRYLGFHTAAYIVDDPTIRAEVGNRFCLTDTIGREMGFYVLRDGRVAVFAVHRTPNPRRPADPIRSLRSTYAGLGWVVPQALNDPPDPEELYYDQVAQIQAPEWSSGRVVLVGDACQAVSLLAGQGASMAVAGSYVLGEFLASAPSVDAALTAYERVWRPVILHKQAAGRRGANWFLPSNRLQLWLRRMVMRAGHLPIATRLVATAVAGRRDVYLAELVQHASSEHAEVPQRRLRTRSASPVDAPRPRVGSPRQ